MMADQEKQQATKPDAEPRGFGEHTRGLAHEQGWQLNEDERRKQPESPENTAGGTDYDYGARDFGDEPVNTATSQSEEQLTQAREALLKED